MSARHHIAHLQFISPADLERFAKLGVTGNFQPLWACNDAQNDSLTVPFVGPERAAWQYRIASLLRLGTRVAFGSDWPVSSADPLQELHVAVNRMLSRRLGEPGTPETTVPLLPGEAIGVDLLIELIDDEMFPAKLRWAKNGKAGIEFARNFNLERLSQAPPRSIRRAG